MCRRGRLLVVVIFVLLAAPSISSAEPIPVPLSVFSADARVVEFSVLSDQPMPYFENGVTFSYTPFGFVSSIFQALNLQQPVTGGTGTLTVTFTDPVTMAGFSFRNHFGMPTMEVAVFADVSGVQPLGMISFGTFTPQETAFIGFAASSAFTRAYISFRVPSAASWFIDDFRFDNAPVPEAGTVSLTLVGMGLLVKFMRRRTTP